MRTTTNSLWKFGPLLGSVGFACTWFLAWHFIPLVGQWWDWLDIQTFYLLNGSLTEDHPQWRFFWALANTRLFDLFVTSFQLLFFVLVGKSAGYVVRLSQFLFFYGYAHASLFLLHGGTVALFDLKRRSPNALLSDGLRLGGVVPGWHVKDISWCSFPGDHCVIALLVGLFTWFYRGPRLGFWALLLSLFVSVPRLFSGAHWLSDIAVGSGFMTMILFSFMAFTPLHRLGYSSTILPVLARLFPKHWGIVG